MSTPSPARSPSAVRVRRRAAAGVLAALACAAGVAVLHGVFVDTTHGQVVDQASQDGARIGRHLVLRWARLVLDVVSGGSLVLAVVVVAAIGLAQRRVRLAVATAVLVGGSTLTTQLLKEVVLHRPDLDVTDAQVNSLPSGHASFAASVSLALLLAVPARLRPAVAVAGAAYTAVTGVATLVVRWHRPSDVVASVLVVGAWGVLASVLGPAPEPLPEPGGTAARVTQRTATALLGAGAVVGAVLAPLLLSATWAATPRPHGRLELLTAYAGGAAAIGAASCALALAVLLLRRPPPGAPADRPAPAPDRPPDPGAQQPAGSLR